MVRAILNNAFDGATFRHDEVFNLDVPVACPGVEQKLLDPRAMWANPADYDTAAADLAAQFRSNFEQFRSLVTPEVAVAGP